MNLNWYTRSNMANYELTFILSGNLTEAKQKLLLEKLTKLIEKEGGKIAKEDKWGKKILAYPIKKQKEGLYFLWQLELPSEKAGGINRSFEIEEGVLRNLLVRR